MPLDPKLTAAAAAAYEEIVEAVRCDPVAAIERFRRSISVGGAETNDLLRALRAQGHTREAFRGLAKIDDMSVQARCKFLSIWSERGQHLRREIADDGIVLAALRSALPIYVGQGTRLYRGESSSDYKNSRIGFSWTSSREVAETYTTRNADGPGGGVLLETIAPIESIICGPVLFGVCDWEYEYIVDPSKLFKIDVVCERAQLK